VLLWKETMGLWTTGILMKQSFSWYGINNQYFHVRSSRRLGRMEHVGQLQLHMWHWPSTSWPRVWQSLAVQGRESVFWRKSYIRNMRWLSVYVYNAELYNSALQCSKLDMFKMYQRIRAYSIHVIYTLTIRTTYVGYAMLYWRFQIVIYTCEKACGR